MRSINYLFPLKISRETLGELYTCNLSCQASPEMEEWWGIGLSPKHSETHGRHLAKYTPAESPRSSPIIQVTYNTVNEISFYEQVPWTHHEGLSSLCKDET
jgi:hypothetical protein